MENNLSEYSKKRKFKETPEPHANTKQDGSTRFVVQEHHASHLHYDFRLEMTAEIDGNDWVLKSWAVPKGIPTEIGVKHLAVEVEDHPIDYIDFEGDIPEGLYGAGTVIIWDSGYYELIKRSLKEIEFKLQGNKLKGRYLLIKTNWKGEKNWLIFKAKRKDS